MVASMENPRSAKNEQAAPRWLPQRKRGVRLRPGSPTGCARSCSFPPCCRFHVS